MDIITEKKKISKKEWENRRENGDYDNTVLKVSFKCDISEDIGDILPYPDKHYINNIRSYYWYIDGFFGTEKAAEYINDIKARFLITYKNDISDIQHYKTEEKAKLHLKDFQKLKSQVIGIINQTNRFDNSQDFIFWSLKLYAEDMIFERGLIDFNTLWDFAYENFNNTSTKACKDNSTLKSKCRSIVNYYIDKDYALDKYKRKTTDEEWNMTRSENLTKVNKQKGEATKRKIENYITGMFAEDYKKPNGKWHITKLQKSLNISRVTLTKYLKELSEGSKNDSK